MSVLKVIELMGDSDKSWEDAAKRLSLKLQSPSNTSALFGSRTTRRLSKVARSNVTASRARLRSRSRTRSDEVRFERAHQSLWQTSFRRLPSL
jgi:hypothetical protein